MSTRHTRTHDVSLLSNTNYCCFCTGTAAVELSVSHLEIFCKLSSTVRLSEMWPCNHATKTENKGQFQFRLRKLTSLNSLKAAQRAK